MKWDSDTCFRLAIASIAQCPVLICPGPIAASPRPSRQTLRHPVGLNSHLIPEIAIALEGRGRMDFLDQSLIFEPPAVILLPPGCTHCEAAFSARTPYTLLWLMGDGSLTTAFVSSFQPGRGWRSPLHRTVRCRSSLRLFAHVRQGIQSGATFSSAVRRDLLDLMVRFYAGDETPIRSRQPGRPVQRYDGLLEQIRDYLDLHFAEPITLPQLAAQVHLTPRYLNRLFHRWSGEALHEFLTRRRMEKALQLCRQKQRLVKEIAAAVGYEDPLYFSRAFRRYFGRSPTEA
jgi:AraC-like DNA-binding protein